MDYHPNYDMSFTLTLYYKYYGRSDSTKRTFTLRNLKATDSDEQITETRQIMNEVAKELHHITGFGVDKGVIRKKREKVDEVLYPNLTPRDEKSYFLYALKFDFFPVYQFIWSNGKREIWLKSDLPKQSDEWAPIIKMLPNQASFKLPISMAVRSGEQRVVYFWKHYKPDKGVFEQFIARFLEAGSLCFGQSYYFTKERKSCYFSEGKWPKKKPQKKNVPRTTVLASRPQDNTDYVYLIRMGPTKIYKIGKSNDPKGRLDSLQTANPYKLKIVHTFSADNASAAEEALHAHFHEKRMQGEWFRLTKEEADILCQIRLFKEKKFVIKQQTKTVQELFVNDN